MQPHIMNGTVNGHVVIDIVKDADAKNWPPIVLDLNNITISKAQGKIHCHPISVSPMNLFHSSVYVTKRIILTRMNAMKNFK